MGSSGHNSFKQQVGASSAGRTQEKRARIAAEEPSIETEFAIEEVTFFDANSGAYVTRQVTKHYILSCNCRVSAPNEIRGKCNGCSRGLFARFRRGRRLVCHRHTLCAKCRYKRLKKQEGRSSWWIWLALIALPIVDVEFVDEEIEESMEPEQPVGGPTYRRH